ncbi:SDR family NAD(P)-dependent oxidoreductase [Sinorhizobium medicae]|uniref:Short chain alcohol dehydrogenase-related dehydrogenase n=1 Tax=Sinorhizobium medicae TaxID=110321 RepID=A0A508X6K2_9HYPH|nr:SDR family oxidoreductase [Sinorhizobium medicae]VTZ65485.1 Short chain alcohol dehydrogenase-related dehydrogenase [Sinorhizobium medicae]
MKRYDNKVAIVTGGGSGIGAAAAKRLLDEGGSVAISGRNRERLAEAARDWPQDRVVIQAADVSRRQDCEALVAATIKRFGRLDTLVNAAGMNLVGSVEDTSEEDWRKCMGADLDSVFFMTKAALPHLKESKGSIINIGSVSSLGGGWKHTAYNSAKAAAANFARSVACDYGKFGVRANTVCPGLTVTGMVDEIMADEKLLEKAWERIPLQRAGKPEEIAAAILFLASDEARWITGVALPVDGGQTCTDGGPEWGK